jgi:hypothetical protein
MAERSLYSVYYPAFFQRTLSFLEVHASVVSLTFCKISISSGGCCFWRLVFQVASYLHNGVFLPTQLALGALELSWEDFGPVSRRA